MADKRDAIENFIFVFHYSIIQYPNDTREKEGVKIYSLQG